MATSLFPIVGMVLMPLTPEARSNGFSLFFGWIAGVAVAGAIFLVVLHAIGVTHENDQPDTWTYW